MSTSRPGADRWQDPTTIPDGFTVWTASDLHGQLASVDRLLERAGLTDGNDRWIAQPRTALVVTGDVVDRGPDALGLVRRLVSLRGQAAARGGLVVLLEGNHEIQVLGGLEGDPAILRALMAFGGAATLLSVGLTPEEWADRPAETIAARVDELAPDFRPALWTFGPYAHWGDVLFVHAGPVPFRDLATFRAGAERLWIRERFFAATEAFPDADAWSAYRAAGMRRVVFGHSPVAAPTLFHGGRAIDVDTWRGGVVSLVRLAPGRSFADARVLAEPVAPRAVRDAALSAAAIEEIDGAMPGIVESWWARRGAVGARGGTIAAPIVEP